MSSPSISDRVRNQVDLKDRRCTWVESDPLMVIYHDTEWGVPVYDDQKLFEFIVLDAMQAGLKFSDHLAETSELQGLPRRAGLGKVQI
jgi:hypothetical protein